MKFYHKEIVKNRMQSVSCLAVLLLLVSHVTANFSVAQQAGLAPTPPHVPQCGTNEINLEASTLLKKLEGQDDDAIIYSDFPDSKSGARNRAETVWEDLVNVGWNVSVETGVISTFSVTGQKKPFDWCKNRVVRHLSSSYVSEEEKEAGLRCLDLLSHQLPRKSCPSGDKCPEPEEGDCSASLNTQTIELTIYGWSRPYQMFLGECEGSDIFSCEGESDY